MRLSSRPIYRLITRTIESLLWATGNQVQLNQRNCLILEQPRSNIFWTLLLFWIWFYTSRTYNTHTYIHKEYPHFLFVSFCQKEHYMFRFIRSFSELVTHQWNCSLICLALLFHPSGQWFWKREHKQFGLIWKLNHKYKNSRWYCSIELDNSIRLFH